MRLQEALLDFEKVSKGDTTAEVATGDDHVRQAAGGWVGAWVVGGGVGDVMYEVLVVRIRELLRAIMFYLRENQGCKA